MPVLIHDICDASIKLVQFKMSYPSKKYKIQEEELIMPRNTKQHSKQFKLDAITYRKEHPDLTQAQCAKNLGIGVSTLARWEQQFRNSDGDIPVRGSGNYESNEAKEIARLKRELRDAQDALDVLKKAIGILGND
jgi:transposase